MDKHHSTLFGHLAGRFAQSPENLATEALGYILGRSDAANAAFTRYLRLSGAKLPDHLVFQTQVREDDDSIPDIRGINGQNKPVVLGEVKFWAGLTANQPIGYAKKLEESGGALLFFLSPTKRFQTLWAELLRRCEGAKLTVSVKQKHSEDYYIARLGQQQRLVLCSWRSVLSTLHDSVEADGDTGAASDLRQLQGLCDYMDTTAFLPLESQELTPAVATRIIQYCDLVNDVTDYLDATGDASTKGLRATSSRGEYGRYMIISHFQCFLHLNAHKWREWHETPLWLRIRHVDKQMRRHFPHDAEIKLSSWFNDKPPRAFKDDKSIWIPIHLPTCAERDAVIASIIKQVKKTVHAAE